MEGRGSRQELRTGEFLRVRVAGGQQVSFADRPNLVPLCRRIVSKLRGVSRVAHDVTSKPLTRCSGSDRGLPLSAPADEGETRLGLSVSHVTGGICVSFAGW